MNLPNNNSHSIEANSYKPLVCRGVRGATTATENSPEAILEATYELLNTMVRLNDMDPEDVASITLTTTTDLDAAYPAQAARRLGWYDTALLCGHEMNVPDGLPRCIRVLIHWNTKLGLREIVHVYLREATVLRPDRNDRPPIRPIQMSAIEAAVRMLGCTP